MANGSDRTDQITLGVIKGAHGVKGLVRLVSYTEDPTALFDYDGLTAGPDSLPCTLEKRGMAKDGFLAKVSSIKTREAAQAARGWELTVARSALADIDGEEDSFYLADLIGLAAQDVSGTRLGYVRSVENFGADDLLELTLDTPIKGLGRFAYIPFTHDLVPSVDIEAGHVVVDMAAWVESQTGKDPEPVEPSTSGPESLEKADEK